MIGTWFRQGSRVRLGCALGIACGSATAASAQLEIHQLSLATRDLVHDPVSGRIYASVPGSAGVNGNTVTWIDPNSLGLGPFVSVGNEPSGLALSDDGQFLYVGLVGDAAVRRFHVPTGSAELQFSLGTGPFGPNLPGDMAVQPGNPGVLAVALKRSGGGQPQHAGLAIFDNGVQRPMTISFNTFLNSIEFSSSPGRLYGFNSETTENAFRRLNVTASGVQVVNAKRTAIRGIAEILFHQGWCTGNTGATIDPETGVTLGTYAGIPNPFFSDVSVATDPARDATYFLVDDKLRVYRRSTYVLLSEVTIPGVQGDTSSLVTWGTDGLAFRSSTNQVFVLSNVRPRHLSILPASGDYLSTQEFDLVLVVEPQESHLAGILAASVDGTDVTSLVRGTAVPGGMGPLDSSLTTRRCPGFSTEVVRVFGAGTHTIDVQVSLADGSDLSATATWNLLPTIEKSDGKVRPR